MHHSTSWWVSALFSIRSDGSSAAIRPSACESLSSSDLVRGVDGDRQQRLGQAHGLSTTRLRPSSERVSPVSARVSRPIAHEVAGDDLRRPGRSCLPKGWDSAPMPLVLVVVGVRPRLAEERREVTGHVHATASGRSVPLKTRTRLSRPTYGSLVVLTTSATSGATGSQVMAGAGLAGGGEHLGRGVLGGRREPARRRGRAARSQPTPVTRADRYDREEGRAGHGSLEVVDQRRLASISSPPR